MNMSKKMEGDRHGGQFQLIAAMRGAPTTIPTARAEVNRSTCGMVIPRSAAMSGRGPACMNSDTDAQDFSRGPA